MAEAGMKSVAWLRPPFRPTLADVFLGVVMARLYLWGEGWASLLLDGDAGWHIRTGEWILEHRRVPTADLFSFSRPGEPWFAWEWLSDVVMGLAHSAWGLRGVAALAGCAVVVASMGLFRLMLLRGASPFVAGPLLILGITASSVHHLARPHLATILLLTLSLCILERDRASGGRWAWLLVPLSAIWVNLHGGFFALPVTLALLSAGAALESRFEGPQREDKRGEAIRYALLSAACLGASLVNPYGWRLHVHVGDYLRSGWVLNSVQEFQSPSFRDEHMLQFEALLFVGLVLCGLFLKRKEIRPALLILAWAHMALVSVRHIPLFVVICAPFAAAELSRLWGAAAEGRSERSASRILWTLGTELAPSFRRHSLWSPVAVAALIWLTPAPKWPADFPASVFPVAIVKAESSRLATARVFTSDQWADYLIYKNWPPQRVFFDGRSDFYGPEIGAEYLKLLTGRRGWEEIFDKYGFHLALVPIKWPLVPLLELHPAWRKVREDEVGVLYERVQPAPPP